MPSAVSAFTDKLGEKKEESGKKNNVGEIEYQGAYNSSGWSD